MLPSQRAHFDLPRDVCYLNAASWMRAPHIVSLKFPNGMPDGLIAGLEGAQIYVASRLGRMRISPHVYNDEADVDRFLEVFRKFAT